MKRTSIKDIARIAGVSVATVSYVLNKKEGSRISEATREKIFEIAETINYTPNKIAKSLKMNRSKLLGLILADISNDFYSGIARCIEDEAMKLGYTLLIGSSDEDPEKFKKLTELFSEQQVDGMIIAPVFNSDDAIKRLIKEKYPVVTIDRYLKNINMPGVMIDNMAISESVGNYLAGKKFEEVIYVGYDTQLPHLLERMDGFEKGITPEVFCKKVLVGLENIAEEVFRGLESNLDLSKKTAFFFSTNKLGIAGLRYFLKNNIKVPQDVSVIAFDETEAYHLFPTEISFVQQPLTEMAKEAVRLMDSQINNYSDNGKKVVFPARLINNKSVG
ncbi:LacI family DNA-binding transcriptional regulator [Chryseobacterium phocaeense]|uniref:LacI family DNA-binding transcriptional regulator n=1 Tax=Chryseobacterium phocaeense TaxID=1816690 RepID=UPI0009BA741B|nr:LacI family DNA-binding transcriptional regulator [Chryseobacterium phocaeense]